MRSNAVYYITYREFGETIKDEMPDIVNWFLNISRQVATLKNGFRNEKNFDIRPVKQHCPRIKTMALKIFSFHAEDQSNL